MKTSRLALAALALLLGCTSTNNSPPANNSPAPTKSEVKATEAELGRAALQKTFIAARGWQRDAQPYLEFSQPTKEVTGADGKATVWTASYGSEGRSLGKTFTWSGTEAADAPPRGLSPTPEDSFSSSNSSTHLFDLNYLKTDSDQAFKVAQEHGGKRLLAKNPAMPVYYRLIWERRDSGLVWHVNYGGTGADSKLAVTVNASTGQFLRKEP